MKRIAIVATLALLAACAKGDKTNATDTSTAGGAVAPAATDSTGTRSRLRTGSTMNDSLRQSDSIHMATGGTPTTSSDSSSMNGSSKTSPTSDKPVMAKGDTLKKAPTP